MFCQVPWEWIQQKRGKKRLHGRQGRNGLWFTRSTHNGQVSWGCFQLQQYCPTLYFFPVWLVKWFEVSKSWFYWENNVDSVKMWMFASSRSDCWAAWATRASLWNQMAWNCLSDASWRCYLAILSQNISTVRRKISTLLTVWEAFWKSFHIKLFFNLSPICSNPVKKNRGAMVSVWMSDPVVKSC